MADVSNLKINERSNVKHPNWGVNKIDNKNSKVKTSKLIYIKGQIWELAKSRAMQNFEWGEQFQNFTIFKIKFSFSKLEIFLINLLLVQIIKLGNLLIFRFGKFQKFPKFLLLTDS